MVIHMSQDLHSDLPPSQKDEDSIRQSRRNLLKMAGAGVPMVITMKASAQQVLISQLRCAFVLGVRQRVLVDPAGNAWVSSRNIRRNNTKGLRLDSIEEFKASATFIGSATGMAGAPPQFRPTACPQGGDGDQYDDWTTCGYNYYRLGRNTNIKPADFLSGSTWNIGSSSRGLYLELSRQMAEGPLSTNGWPGISCVISVLTYLQMNGG